MKKYAPLIALIVFPFFAIYGQNIGSKIKQDVFTLASDSMMGREADSFYGRKAADYITQRFDEMGLKIVNQAFRSCPNNYNNLYYVFEGNDSILKNEYIVLGAHYDGIGLRHFDDTTTIYKCADDNASGVACLMEMARLMKENPKGMKRSVILAFFDANRDGYYGSEYLADVGAKYKGELINYKNVKLMINVEKVGALKDENLLEIIGVEMIDDYESYFNNLTLNNAATPLFENYATSGHMTILSDNGSFLQRDIASLYVSTGKKKYHNSPKDTPELIDIKGLEDISSYLYAVTERIANSSTLNTNHRGTRYLKRVEERFYWGASFGIGAMNHQYLEGRMNGKGALSLGAGIFVKAAILPSFSIRTGLNYSYSGGNRYEGVAREHILTVPAVFALDLTTGTGGTLSLGVGPYYDWSFHNTMKIDGIKYQNTLNQHDVGLMGILSLRVKRLIFGVEVKGGFLDVDKNYELKSTRINSMVRIGFVF